MAQQSVRLLLKTYKSIRQGGMRATGIFAYLNRTMVEAHSTATAVEDFLMLEHLEKALEVRAAYLVRDAFEKIQANPNSSHEKENSLFALERLAASQAHIQYVTFKLFKESLESPKLTCE
mmetsp:Transcript_3412/g.2388  ORF Transcript_3412/g.2388 Transcript_3412/m.2388 type:complete len:120 (+) Transcript_3412:1347-1706(+)